MQTLLEFQKNEGFQNIPLSNVIIYEFKKHLTDKWKKNKANQQLNKIVHYHIQSTFFLRFGAPLFLESPDALEKIKFQKTDSIQTKAKKIHHRFVLEGKKVKSIEVISLYCKKLQEYNLFDQFISILGCVILRVPNPLIKKEFHYKKFDLFYYISPIIACLLIFQIKVDKKPNNLDDLLLLSGLKALMKSVKDNPKELYGEKSEQCSQKKQQPKSKRKIRKNSKFNKSENQIKVDDEEIFMEESQATEQEIEDENNAKSSTLVITESNCTTNNFTNQSNGYKTSNFVEKNQEILPQEQHNCIQSKNCEESDNTHNIVLEDNKVNYKENNKQSLEEQEQQEQQEQQEEQGQVAITSFNDSATTYNQKIKIRLCNQQEQLQNEEHEKKDEVEEEAEAENSKLSEIEAEQKEIDESQQQVLRQNNNNECASFCQQNDYNQQNPAEKKNYFESDGNFKLNNNFDQISFCNIPKEMDIFENCMQNQHKNIYANQENYEIQNSQNIQPNSPENQYIIAQEDPIDKNNYSYIVHSNSNSQDISNYNEHHHTEHNQAQSENNLENNSENNSNSNFFNELNEKNSAIGKNKKNYSNTKQQTTPMGKNLEENNYQQSSPIYCESYEYLEAYTFNNNFSLLNDLNEQKKNKFPQLSSQYQQYYNDSEQKTHIRKYTQSDFQIKSATKLGDNEEEMIHELTTNLHHQYQQQ